MRPAASRYRFLLVKAGGFDSKQETNNAQREDFGFR